MKKPTTAPAGVVEFRPVPDQEKKKRPQSQRRKARGLARQNCYYASSKFAERQFARQNCYYASAKFAERQCEAAARVEEESVTGCGVVRGRDGESWKDSVCPPVRCRLQSRDLCC